MQLANPILHNFEGQFVNFEWPFLLYTGCCISLDYTRDENKFIQKNNIKFKMLYNFLFFITNLFFCFYYYSGMDCRKFSM